MSTKSRTARLLVVADTLDGGLGAAVLTQATWFRGRGWSVALAAPAAPILGESPDGLHVIAIPNRVFDASAMFRAARDLRGLLLSFRPTAIHCHGLRSMLVTALAGRRAFVTIHGPGSLPGEPRFKRSLRRLVLRLAPVLTLEAFSDGPGYDGWLFLPHGSPRLQDLERLPFPQADTMPMFLWVGRLEDQKRCDLFVEAMAQAARDVPVRGIVAGGGSLEPALRRLAAERRAPISFVGATDHVERLLEETWTLVLLSRWEGLPLVLTEAMWAGRPVVASRLPGAEWLVGDAGYLVDSLDDTVAAILALTDHGHAASLGGFAADRARMLISPEMPWPATEAAYRDRKARRPIPMTASP